MGILRRGDDDEEDEGKKHHSRAKERQAQKAALTQAQEISANPQFIRQLQDFDLDSEQFPDMESELGPLAAGSAVLGNREEHFEHQQRWLNANKGERVVAEGEPGRLCRGRILEIAHNVHNRPDKDAPSPRTQGERRAIRDALKRITNVETLSQDGRLLRALTESVAVTKTEGEDSGAAESAARFIG